MYMSWLKNNMKQRFQLTSLHKPSADTCSLHVHGIASDSFDFRICEKREKQKTKISELREMNLLVCVTKIYFHVLAEITAQLLEV